ncbi:MAG: type II toxin-antitoxin system VapC family toxin [Thermodesulfobacteriota bacterium]|nr:type II toxin-antitoxin system VapC family toxin [Thermodesulfobacteriota bacterium]
MKLITPSALKKRISGKKILIDTNIIIYLTDMIQPYEPLSRLIFEMIEIGDASAVLSIISVAEVMQGPIKKGRHQNAQDVKNYLINFPNIFCQEITMGVLGRMGKNNLINWSRLRTTDSLIIASGLSNGVELFISNDTHFKKAIPGNFVLSFDA